MALPISQSSLALDCSTDTLSLALNTPKIRLERDFPGGAQASSRILHEIERLLADGQTAWSELDVLVCGHGPGAFTGVRVSIAVVQGLATAHALPVYAASGLLAIAEQARLAHYTEAENLRLTAMLDARMGQVYAANCLWNGQRWHCDGERLLDYAEVAQIAAPITAPIIAGNIRQALAAAGLDTPAVLHDSQPSAAALLRLMQQDVHGNAGGQWADPSQLLPVYVRNKVAQTTAERELLKSQGRSGA
jgi:tRNA threonylcarbamoyladenosine biosynthesis protein TsaB